MGVLQKEDIVNAVYAAGVTGCGGAGFPTHVKLQASVDTVIANGSECEPLLWTDKLFMMEHAARMVEGIRLAMQATGAKRGIVAIKGYYKEVIERVKPSLPADGSVTLHELNNYYPAGDEFLTVYDITGRVIPEGGIPLQVGVVVSNVITFAQIADAVSGKPVTERALTIGGEVWMPKVVTAPIGTTYLDLIEMAGGRKDEDTVVIDGGPMMGNIVTDLNTGMGKVTSGILILPADNFVIRMKTKTVQQMVKLSKAACCQCSRCTDLCPRYLLGHELYPHMTMRTIDYNMADPTHHITAAFLCSQCGVCEMIACDFMLLSPKMIYAAYRKQLTAEGVKSPHKKKPERPLDFYFDRQVDIPTVLKKLGLTRYYGKIPLEGFQSVGLVRIPLTRHIGAPAVASVTMGQRVKKGEEIAATPKEKLGARYHASIDGKVTAICSEYIEITA